MTLHLRHSVCMCACVLCACVRVVWVSTLPLCQVLMTVFGSRGVPIRLWAKHTTQLVPAALLGVGPATLGIVEVDVTTGERLHGGRPTAVVNFTVAPPAEAQTLLANRFHMHAASPSLQSLAADNAALEVCHPWVPPLPDAWSDVQLFTSVQLEGREVQFTVGRHEAAAQVRAHSPYTVHLCAPVCTAARRLVVSVSQRRGRVYFAVSRLLAVCCGTLLCRRARRACQRRRWTRLRSGWCVPCYVWRRGSW